MAACLLTSRRKRPQVRTAFPLEEVQRWVWMATATSSFEAKVVKIMSTPLARGCPWASCGCGRTPALAWVMVIEPGNNQGSSFGRGHVDAVRGREKA
jgi:hypothetical protein